MFQRLLICTDLSDGLQRLVHFVPDLAAANIQQITFLHCVPLIQAGYIPRVDEKKVEQARSQLASAQKDLPVGATVVVQVESGRPIDHILRVAKEHQSDLLMLGYSLRSAFSEKLFGSTAIEVYKRSNLPILSVRPQLISTYTAEELALRCQHILRHLMIPYDGTEAAKSLIEQLKQKVKQSSKSVLEACYICWIVDDCNRRDIPHEPFLQQAQKELATVRSELEALNLRVEIEARLGSPVFETIKAASEPDVSAIAVCHGPRHNWLQRSAPSFTQGLLQHSWYPVLYFPFVRQSPTN